MRTCHRFVYGAMISGIITHTKVHPMLCSVKLKASDCCSALRDAQPLGPFPHQENDQATINMYQEIAAVGTTHNKCNSRTEPVFTSFLCLKVLLSPSFIHDLSVERSSEATDQ